MVLSKSILILEDNLKVLSSLLDKLNELEGDQPYDLNLVVLTNFQQVEDYINSNPKADFDVIILDRDCKLNGSFHNLDINRFGIEKVISISTVEEYNEDMKRKGVTRIVLKNIGDLEEFSIEVVKNVQEMIR